MARARGLDALPAYRQERIRRVVLYIAAHGPSTAGGAAPFDDLDLGEAKSLGYVRAQEGTLKRALTEKGRRLAVRLGATAIANPLGGAGIVIGLGVLGGLVAIVYYAAKALGTATGHAIGSGVSAGLAGGQSIE